MKRMIIAAATLAVLIASPAQAQAGSNCAPRDVVVAQLASKFGESRKSMGLGGNNSVIEVFASESSGTWTITVTSPTGITCLVASGQAYEALAEALPAQGNDA